MICRFRRQHEQLRQVIVRVLRPAMSSVPVTTSESHPSAEPLAIEPADNSSIDVCTSQTLFCHLFLSTAEALAHEIELIGSIFFWMRFLWTYKRVNLKL